jgi:DNA-binding XRE family transcriptional regulator
VADGAGASFRYLRELAELTLEEAATAIETAPSYLEAFETGSVRPHMFWVRAATSRLIDRMLRDKATSR